MLGDQIIYAHSKGQMVNVSYMVIVEHDRRTCFFACKFVLKFMGWPRLELCLNYYQFWPKNEDDCSYKIVLILKKRVSL